MNYLVTGGAGFIGSNLAQYLASRGHKVIVLDNLSTGHRKNLPSGIRFREGDVRNFLTLTKCARNVDVIFHLAASVGNTRSIADPILDAETNVIGTLNVLEAAKDCGVRRVVYSSSAGIFGQLKTLPIREDHPVEPDSPYGASKLCAEKMCLAYAKLHGLEAICLRYFNVYGPHQRFDAYGNCIPIFTQQIFAHEPITIFGDGRQTRDFVNVADVVQANYQAAFCKTDFGAFNIGSGTRITLNRLIELMAVASGAQPMVEYGPPRALAMQSSCYAPATILPCP